MINKRMTVGLLAIATSLGACWKTPTPQSEPSIASVAKVGEKKISVKIGIPECDQYLAHYQACVSEKAPENLRSELMKALNQTKESWRGADSTPEGRAVLASTCSKAAVAMKVSMAAYGCAEF